MLFPFLPLPPWHGVMFSVSDHPLITPYPLMLVMHTLETTPNLMSQINASLFSLIRVPFVIKPAYPLTVDLVTIRSILTMNIIPVKFLKSRQHLEYQREVLKMTVIRCCSM